MFLCTQRKDVPETMKKVVSLLLALVMAVSCMAGLALAAELSEIAPSKAGWQVKTADGTAYYIQNLDSIALEWAVEQEGGVTFTALKGGALPEKGVKLPADRDTDPIVIDLNGFSFTHSGNAIAFSVTGDGNLTLKNGAISCVSGTNVVNLGLTTAGNNDGAGYYYKPTLTLENLYIDHTTPNDGKVAGGVPIISSTLVHLNLNIKNTTLVTNNKEFCGVGNFYNLNGDVAVDIQDSVFVSAADRIFRMFPGTGATPNVQLTVSNAVFASATGNIVGGGNYSINGAAGSGNGNTAGGELVAPWSGKTPDGTEVTAANATVVGTAPEKTTIPATVTIELPKDPEPVTPPAPPVVEPDPTPSTPVTPDPTPVTPDPTPSTPVTPDPTPSTPVTPSTPDEKDPEPVTPAVPDAPEAPAEGPSMTLIVVIASAAVVVACIVVIIVVKKKRS